MQVMGARCATPGNRPITELIAIIAVGVAVLGQAAWLGGKIEDLEDGQAEIREHLAGMEIRLGVLADLTQTETAI